MTIEQVGGRMKREFMTERIEEGKNPYKDKDTYLKHFGAFSIENDDESFDPRKGEKGKIHITTKVVTDQWEKKKKKSR